MAEKIHALRVKYIKLGKNGRWEEECARRGILRLGYDTQEHFDMCAAGNWSVLAKIYQGDRPNQGVATGTVNQIRSVFEDDGQTLWVTFHGRKLHWAFLDPTVPATVHEDGQGTFRVTRDGWKTTDVEGKVLHMANLSGRITKVAAYQRTICNVKDPKGLLRRINAELHPDIALAQALLDDLRGVVARLLGALTWQDFELLVDLIFSTSGWRRLGVLGGTEKAVDIELILPTTGEIAFVQVKSETCQAEFDGEYRPAFEAMTQYSRMFFVYHSGSVSCPDLDAVTIHGPTEVAEMVIEAGLVSWLMARVS